MKTIFLNSEARLRNGWWAAIFLGLLTLILFPSILLSQHFHHDLTLLDQGAMLLVVTAVCQALRRKAFSEVTGRFDQAWLRDLAAGGLAGVLLMIVPALFLFATGAVGWHAGTVSPAALCAGILTMAAVAIAEELLFRGFLFQRLIAGLGVWPAQAVLGGMFLLTHLGNPGMSGVTAVLAGTNIFLASILFGLAWVRTRRLALPIGIHFMANVTQGQILGFGVSGNSEAGLLVPVFRNAPQWLTGGAFGLEASLPGLICVLIGIGMLWRMKPHTA